MAHVTSTFLRHYDAAFAARPLATMMVTNTVLNAIADATAQAVTTLRERSIRSPNLTTTPSRASEAIHAVDEAVGGGKLIPPSETLPPPFDWGRLGRFMSWGCIIAPFQFKWFQFLSRRFPIRSGASVGPLAKRVGLDQAAFAPVGLAGFFTWMSVTEGSGYAEVRRKFESVYLKALRAISLVTAARSKFLAKDRTIRAKCTQKILREWADRLAESKQEIKLYPLAGSPDGQFPPGTSPVPAPVRIQLGDRLGNLFEPDEFFSSC